MIKVENMSYSFPNKDLYTNVSFTIEENKHCAFIGSSGSGKSTLIDIIMKPDEYLYDGSVEVKEQTRYGYVSQFIDLDKPEETTAFDYIAGDYIYLENEIAKICVEMEDPENMEEKLEKYQALLDAFDAISGEDYESKIEKKLNLIGLLQHRHLTIADISGGEFKLIQVIKEMLHSPDLLIMDEPDVFLDFENLGALMDLINSHKKTLLVITHNRFLLSHCFNKIIHLENADLQEYDGRYLEYNFNLLQTKIELMEMSIADDEEIKRNEALIDRLREIATLTSDASKGRALRARVKFQERLEARRVKAPFVDIKKPNIHLSTEEAAADTVLKVNDLSLSYDDILLKDIHFELEPTDKVALIGLNGTGKTTLFRAINENDNEGIIIGEDVSLNYLSQHQNEMFKESNTILNEFYDLGFESYGHIKSYLFGFGFEEKYLKHTISDLSGGERNLLQLAKIGAEKGNFLLLDEPTSHLDTYAQIALEEAINEYEGAILMISHDYYTITNCMDYVLLIENGTIRKMKMKKFKRMIYANHFSRDYLENEQKKKALETTIELALKQGKLDVVKANMVKLEEIIKLL